MRWLAVRVLAVFVWNQFKNGIHCGLRFLDFFFFAPHWFSISFRFSLLLRYSFSHSTLFYPFLCCYPLMIAFSAIGVVGRSVRWRGGGGWWFELQGGVSLPFLWWPLRRRFPLLPHWWPASPRWQQWGIHFSFSFIFIITCSASFFYFLFFFNNDNVIDILLCLNFDVPSSSLAFFFFFFFKFLGQNVLFWIDMAVFLWLLRMEGPQ